MHRSVLIILAVLLGSALVAAPASAQKQAPPQTPAQTPTQAPAQAPASQPAAAPDQAAAPAPQVAKTSCTICHSSTDWFDKDDVHKVVDGFAGGVHAAAGLTCSDCHGGNPDPALGSDLEAAMDTHYARRPFIGAPDKAQIPAFCGRCHSDPTYMRRFKPDARVDQQREYATSQHGHLLAKGDKKVATCVDCHGVHGILAPDNPDSPVYPTKVALTCKKCHADPKYMAGYKTEDGRPLPVDQYALWSRSVHAAAMFQKEDLSAPTCNDCHGNHGAAPPGLDSIAFVCGQCHGREADLFRKSPKHAGFQQHNELIAGLGPGACANCHEPPEPQAKLTDFRSFSECITCHGNHAVIRPTIAMLAPLPEVPCAFCHEGTGPLADGQAEAEGPASADPLTATAPQEPEKVRQHYEATRDGLLAEAKTKHLEGTALFDWMVDQALALPFHNLPQSEAQAKAAEGGAAGIRIGGEVVGKTLRPEFKRLFEKFRIGKTYFTYEDPKTGKLVQGKIRRCSDCHSPQPQLADAAVGYDTSEAFLTGMRELTGLTARAERILLAARRGGVEVQDASLAVDHAVDAQIQLEVMVHTFSDAKDGAFETKRQEGVKQARTAVAKAEDALNQLGFRRRGLVVSLVLILLVLVGLALKIRQLGSG